MKHFQRNLLRRDRHTTLQRNGYLTMESKHFIHFGSNDYFGLSHHPDIIKATCQAIETFGIGSTSSPQIGGYHPTHQNVEHAFAEHLSYENGMLFTSGFLANLAVMTCTASRATVVLADRSCHASLLDGIMLSRAHLVRFPHQDEDAVARLIQKHHPQLIVSESLFSMEGSITNMKTLSSFQLPFILDDSHGFGFLSTTYYPEPSNILYRIISFGKSLGGSGAIVLGSHSNIEALLQHARSYRYSTALAPALAEAALASLRIIQEEPWRRHYLEEICSLFNHYATKLGIPIDNQEISPIRPITIADIPTLQHIQRNIQEAGYFVPAIRPPTVPSSGSRLRVSLNIHHTKKHIRQLLTIIAKEMV